MNVTVGDAYGQLLLAELVQGGGVEIVEREDGYIAASVVGPAIYLAPFRRWSSEERRGMRFARGRVLDVGSGGGRVCLHLQDRGHEVVGIDNSPLAIEVCRMRGVRDARLVAIEDVDDSLGRFDTIVMYGNNFGLVSGAEQAGRILRRFHALTSPRGRILATSRDIYRTEDPIHLAYQARNRERGRMSGQIRIRIRYRDVASPWFDYLMASPDEMQELAEPAGWHVSRVLQGEDTYVAVLEKRR